MSPKRRPRKGTLSHALVSGDLTELSNIVSRCDLDRKALFEVMKDVKRSSEEFGDYMSPLQVAISQGHYDICKQLIEEGAALKTSAISSTPHPLCLALWKGRFNIARLLIKAGADVTLKFGNVLPMYYALQSGSCTVQIVEDMIAAGFSPNKTIEYTLGQTSLHIAVYKSFTSIVKYLLSIPVDLDQRDKSGVSPLHYAAQMNNAKMVRLLVRNGANVNVECKKGLTPLLYAILFEHDEMVKLLISLGAEIHYVSTRSSIMPLHYAAYFCRFRISQLLIEKGADVNKVSPASGESPLHTACRANHQNMPNNKVALNCIVELFIREGAYLEARQTSGSTPLEVAINAKNTSLAKILIMSGANINSYITPEDYSEIILHLVARAFDKDLLRFCLDYGGDYMAENKIGVYPCTIVFTSTVVPSMARQQPSDILAAFKLFWNHGFPFDKVITKRFAETLGKMALAYPPIIGALMNKQTNLFKGVKKCDLEIVKKAIAQGAEVKCCSLDIPQPLHYLALKGSEQIMKEFVLRGVIVNFLNETGETPLHIAARCGHIDCCKVLLENGAVYNFCDSAKLIKTPLQLAKYNRHSEIVKLFTKVDSYFKDLKKGNLKKISAGMKISRAVMNCRHRDGMTLMERAIHLNMRESADQLMKLRLQMTS